MRYYDEILYCYVGLFFTVKGSYIMLKRGDTFNIGEVCEESGVYRLKGKCASSCGSEEQREIPLTKGEKFPPCRSCKGKVVWEFVRQA